MRGWMAAPGMGVKPWVGARGPACMAAASVQHGRPIMEYRSERMELVIGDKAWSSWSLRPWLALKRAGADFTETLVPLRQLDTSERLAPYSPGGQCPVLIDGDLTVWDSLAICEYVAERFPGAGLWPQDAAKRALGRAAVAQMHSGFPSLRGECPMDLAAPVQVLELTEATQADVRKLVRLWTELLDRSGGPFLLGDWSIADAYYTPVATRLRTYGVALTDYGDDSRCGAYAALLLEQGEFVAWEKAALGAG
jgi:glutathione S-transferase